VRVWRKALRYRGSRPESLSAAWADDFASVARRLECDKDKERFEATLAKIAKAKPAVK
jgi:hypothetical protein